jgi:hypothetical protein
MKLYEMKPEPKEDEIGMILRQTGMPLAKLDRLARLAENMQHLEWTIARRTAARADQSRCLAAAS